MEGDTEGHTGPPIGIKSMDEVKRTAKVVRSSMGCNIIAIIHLRKLKCAT